MKKTLSIALLTLAASGIILGGASSAYANNDHHSDRDGCNKEQRQSDSKHERDGFKRMNRALHNLDLNITQKSEIKDIISAAKPQMKAIYQEIKEGREALRALSMNNRYDADAVRHAANDQANLIAQKIVLRAETNANISKVLTSDQRQQLAEKSESRKHH